MQATMTTARIAAERSREGRPEARPLPRSMLLGCFLHVLGWCRVGVRLQPVKIIGGLLRVAGGGEDRPLVVLQDFQP
jgi:hypothetical protein